MEERHDMSVCEALPRYQAVLDPRRRVTMSTIVLNAALTFAPIIPNRTLSHLSFQRIKENERADSLG